MTFCYNSLSDDIVDIAINHLTMNVINTKASREIQKKDAEKFKEMRTKVVEYVWELMNSSVISKYNISFEDKRKLIIEFIDKTI
ncbi:hypothetical protein GTQ40_05070 [Flavobacteriaceae bacterium R38]|nr:hypothetical protein [Flavobacteriaceae bacterium R38]